MIAALVLAAVAPSIVAVDGTWVFDDHNLIVTNPHVHGFALWTKWFTSHFWDVFPEGDPPQHAIFWRPLVLASYALDWSIGNGSTVPFHITNLLLHAAATVLTFVVLRRWSRCTLPAFAITLLLAVHPFRTESVSWIAGRPDPLMMIGVLLALQGLARRLAGGRGGIRLELLGAAIAYLSKEHAVALPALALAEGWVAANGEGRARRILEACAPHAVVAVLYVVMRQWLLPMNMRGAADWPIEVRAGVVFETLGRYATIIMWPEDLTLGAGLIYLSGNVPRVTPSNVALGVAVVVGLAAFGLWGWFRRPTATIGVIALAGAMFPISNVFSLGYFVFGSPRLLYLPALPIGFVCVEAALWVGEKLPILSRSRVSAALAASLALVLGASHVHRALAYRSSDRFWHVEASRNPRYFPALQYLTLRSLQAKRPREALRLAHIGFGDVRTTLGTRAAPKFMMYALAAAVRLTPDLDQPSLLAMFAFLTEARSGRRAELNLPQFGLVMLIPAQSADAAPLRTEFGSLVVVELGSRIGKWDEVRQNARELLRRSVTRSGITRALGEQAARNHDEGFLQEAIGTLRQAGFEVDANDLARTATMLPSVAGAPPPIRASFYANLGGWGQAWDALETLAGGSQSQEQDELVAEIAFRAGNDGGARRLLLRWHPPAKAEDTLAAWSRSMQWTDNPLPNGLIAVPDSLAGETESLSR